MNARQLLIHGGAILAAVSLLAVPAVAQEIYKTVDEDGNVVYTDRKPSEDAEPVLLPELTVVDPVDLGDAEAAAASGNTEPPELSGPALQIVSPTAEETIWNTAYVLRVDVTSGDRLPPDTQLHYLIDGEERATSRAQTIEIEEVYRGEHQLRVELRNSNGDVLSSAGPVTFYMRQHSRLHPNPN